MNLDFYKPKVMQGLSSIIFNIFLNIFRAANVLSEDSSCSVKVLFDMSMFMFDSSSTSQSTE